MAQVNGRIGRRLSRKLSSVEESMQAIQAMGNPMESIHMSSGQVISIHLMRMVISEVVRTSAKVSRPLDFAGPSGRMYVYPSVSLIELRRQP
jgi:hypothetical protein